MSNDTFVFLYFFLFVFYVWTIGLIQINDDDDWEVRESGKGKTTTPCVTYLTCDLNGVPNPHHLRSLAE